MVVTIFPVPKEFRSPLSHASTARQGDSAVVRWNQAALDVVRRGRAAPLVAARALAMAHTAAFDACWAQGGPAAGAGRGGAGRRPWMTRAEKDLAKAVSFAFHASLSNLFPSPHAAALFDGLMADLGYDRADASAAANAGRRAAAAVASRFRGPRDGAFAVSNQAWLRPPAPAAYPSRAFVEEAEEVLKLNATLRDREKMIVEYWASGPYSEGLPGLWNTFARFVSRRDRHRLGDDVKMFFALNTAVLDAGLAARACKRVYDAERPAAAIRRLFRGQPILAWGGPFKGTRTILGETWAPYQPASLAVPSSPGYVSEHSTISVAAASVLRSFTGSDWFGAHVTLPAGSSASEPGEVPARAVVLSWDTFTQAAAQAGLSRRLGGFQFLQGDLEGRRLGRRVGHLAWLKALARFQGEAALPGCDDNVVEAEGPAVGLEPAVSE